MRHEEALFARLIQQEKIASWFTIAHWRVMVGLWDAGASRKEAAKKFVGDILKSNKKLTDVLKELRKADFIHETKTKDDERVDLVSLTPKAHRKLEAFLVELDREMESLVREK